MKSEVGDLGAAVDANGEGGHADAAVDVKRRAVDLEHALHVLMTWSGLEPGPIDEWQVDLAPVGVAGEDQVEGLSPKAGHDVGRVGQQQPAHSSGYVLDGL